MSCNWLQGFRHRARFRFLLGAAMLVAGCVPDDPLRLVEDVESPQVEIALAADAGNVPAETLCIPVCNGKKCGDDGCRGTCGECEEGYECASVARVCEAKCESYWCQGKECGVAGPGDECDCGLCPAPANPCLKAGCTAEHMCMESPWDAIGCDDGNPCTYLDKCADGVCLGQVKAGHCFIEGACYQNGAVKPKSPCLECASASAPDSWSLVLGGLAFIWIPDKIIRYACYTYPWCMQTR